MPNIVQPNAEQPIVNKAGSMSDAFRLWTGAITRMDIIVGTGSPEGVISAGVTRLYMDDAGTTGSILYIKQLAQITNDPKNGWILV